MCGSFGDGRMTLDPAPLVPQSASLSCPTCGAGIALHAHGWAVTVVCASCRSVLDATDPNLTVLQKAQQALQVTPYIPLGTRGTWKGAPWEVIGFQQVTITVEGVDYSWREYVCYNPYRGFLYLSEYNGHWNVIDKLRRRPTAAREDERPVVRLDGTTYKHFQTATARTSLALGEFPWALRVGDTVATRDFTAPPYLLSAEVSGNEVTWSMGTYTPADVIQKAFGLKNALIRPIGVFVNQPNPYRGLATSMTSRMGVLLVVLVVLLLGNILAARGTTVFENAYAFAHDTEDSSAFVTTPFALDGRTSSVTMDIASNVNNNWVFFGFSLINEATGETREASQQVSFYSGRDSDGSWSEGSKRESVRFATVPAGRYFLRVQPEGGEPGVASIDYKLTVRRDVPHFGFYGIALLALLLPPLFAAIPMSGFEGRRWAESDYGSATGSGSDDE